MEVTKLKFAAYKNTVKFMYVVHGMSRVTREKHQVEFLQNCLLFEEEQLARTWDVNQRL